MTEINPTSQDMDVDIDRVSPLRPVTAKFSDRYKTLLQESPPRDYINQATTSDNAGISQYQQSSLRNLKSPSSPRKIRDALSNLQSPSSTIKNEDRGHWREADSPKFNSSNQQLKQEEQKEVPNTASLIEKQSSQESNVNHQEQQKQQQSVISNNNEKKGVEGKRKTKTIIKKSLPTPSTSKASSSTITTATSSSTTRALPRYMQPTQSFKTKFESKTPDESPLGVRTSKKISKPSKIPRRKPVETDDDEELKRLSFRGNYIPMAARIKSFEKGLRQGETLQSSISNVPAPVKKTTAPKFKEFKFATSERSKRHKKE